jgi:hypothetical protein
MWQNIRCSILFHLLVPGGKWHTWMAIPSPAARSCKATFQSRHRLPLLPPPSAVISSRSAPRYRLAPILLYQRRIASVANLAVSWSTPTLTQPWFTVTS